MDYAFFNDCDCYIALLVMRILNVGEEKLEVKTYVDFLLKSFSLFLLKFSSKHLSRVPIFISKSLHLDVFPYFAGV